MLTNASEDDVEDYDEDDQYDIMRAPLRSAVVGLLLCNPALVCWREEFCCRRNPCRNKKQEVRTLPRGPLEADQNSPQVTRKLSIDMFV